MSNPSGERTEQATPKRMEEVRREGRLSSSKDMTGWISVAAGALMLPVVLHSAQEFTTAQVRGLAEVIRHPEVETAERIVFDAFGGLLPILAPLFAAVVIGAIVGTLLQGGVHLKHFKPNVDQFNLVKGVPRLFGRQALWEGAKSLLKTGVLGTALWFAIQGILPLFANAGGMTMSSLVSIAGGVIGALMQAAIVAGVALAAVDVLVVMKRNRKHTMMTKQEVKDEAKSSEGDPLVRQQRRSRALAMSRNRMMAAIGGADVVLLNPTHVAVALKYEPGRSAPRVVAKGADEVAARIRERAADLQVPMVTDVPLARALYSACKIDQEIPEELYGAVARVLAFVASLKRRGASIGIHRMAG